jgi:hypothetical protein
MLETILAVLLSLPAWHGDVETPAERRARLTTVATAIATAARGDRQVAAALVVQGNFETHYARHVHEGRCGQHPKSRVGECDRGESVGLWQARRGSWLPQERWESFKGADLDSTTKAAQYAARALRGGLYACGRLSGPEAAFARAATSRCTWEGAARRADEWRRIVGRL